MTTSILEFIESPKDEINTYDFYATDKAREIVRSILHDLTISHKPTEIENALTTLETLNTTLYYMSVFGFLSYDHYQNIFHRIRSAIFFIKRRYKEVKE